MAVEKNPSETKNKDNIIKLDLEKENKHLKQIVQAKDTAILNLQLQVLQLTEANKIVEDSDIPSNRDFRNAWTVDESDLTDGEGS